MLFLFLFSLALAQDLLILGGGPVGLYSAFQALQSGKASRVIVSEKRVDSNPMARTQVIQFYKQILPELCSGGVCKFGVGKIPLPKELNDKLDHASIGNIQKTVLNAIKTRFPNQFDFVGMNSLEKASGGGVKLDIPASKLSYFIPDTIVDATGSRSALLHQVLDVPYKEKVNFGSGLTYTWPDHEIVSTSKRYSRHHDCHGGQCAKGYSSKGSIAPFQSKHTELLRDMGYQIPNDLKGVEIRPQHAPMELDAFLNDLMDPRLNPKLKEEAKSFFAKMRAAGGLGMNGVDMIEGLKKLDQLTVPRAVGTTLKDLKIEESGAKTLARSILSSVDQNYFMNTAKDPFKGYQVEITNLRKVTSTFLPFRTEKYLERMDVNKIPLWLKIGGISRFHEVSALGVGDSIATSDPFRSTGLNRGLIVSKQVFGVGKAPAQVFDEFIAKNYQSLHSDYNQYQDQVKNSRSYINNAINEAERVGNGPRRYGPGLRVPSDGKEIEGLTTATARVLQKLTHAHL